MSVLGEGKLHAEILILSVTHRTKYLGKLSYDILKCNTRTYYITYKLPIIYIESLYAKISQNINL